MVADLWNCLRSVPGDEDCPLAAQLSVMALVEGLLSLIRRRQH
jgi:hypothetical protein